MHSSGFQTYYSDAVAGLDLNQATRVTCRPFRTYYVTGKNEVIYGIKLLSSYTRVQAKSEFGDDLTLDGAAFSERRKEGYIGALNNHLVSHTVVNGPFKEVKIIDGLAEIQAIGDVKVRESFDIDADMDIYARYEGIADSKYMSDGITTHGPIPHDNPVTAWIDQSGNGHNLRQTNPLMRPRAHNSATAGGVDGITFNSTNLEHFDAYGNTVFDFGIQSPAGGDMQSWTIAAVINTEGSYNGTICSRGSIDVATNLQYWLLVDGQTFAGGSGGCSYQIGPTTCVGDEWITGGSVIIIATVGVVDQDAFIFHYRANDADGTNTQVAGSLSNRWLHVGIAQALNAPLLQYGFNGFMHELIFINNRQNSNDTDTSWGSKQMTYEQLDALGTYLSNKWPPTAWVEGVT